MVPLRSAVPSFAATPNTPVNAIHGTLVETVHAQPVGVDT
jgi:hypothetical protein